MKKITRSFAVILTVAMMAALLASCSRTPSNPASFKKLAESKEYEFYDTTDQYANVVQIKECYIASPSSHAFKIEFYVATDKESAKKLYQAQSEIMDNFRGNVYTGGVSNGSNYAKRTMITNGKYLMVTYIDNTLIYVPPTPKENKDEIDQFIDEFHY